MKLTHIYLDKNKSETIDVGEETIKNYLGGLGIALWIMDEKLKQPADALNPDVPLVFTAGLLNATGFPSASKVLFCAVSPATNLVSMSVMGGGFGDEMSRTGAINYVLTGKASEPSIMVIENDSIRIIQRKDLWGLGVTETTEKLEKEYPRFEIAVIGPAGEKMIPFAAIRGKESHSAGRAGLGAVMGSKNLKAIVVKGNKNPSIASDEYKQFVREQLKKVRENVYLKDVQGKYGTLNLVSTINEAGGLPVSNFRYITWDDAKELYIDNLLKYVYKSTTCKRCPVACRKHVLVDNREMECPEYESLWALGPNNEISDFAVITKANMLCNEFGFDTISVGVLISLYQEYKGVKLTGEQLLRLIESIALQDGVGADLAKGIIYVQEKWGVDYAMHVKGLELPAYDPRRFKGMALAYATSQRGGCHCRGWTVGEEFEGQYSPRELAEMVIRYQDAACIRDCLITCVFVDGTFTLDDYAEALTLVSGITFSADDLKLAGERIFQLNRRLNLKQGMKIETDTLPERLIENKIEFENALTKYYELRGWAN